MYFVTGFAGHKLCQKYMFQFIAIQFLNGDETVRAVTRTATKPWLSENLLPNIKKKHAIVLQ